jgi:nucleotide-binding universal stress UspA family protein
MEHLASKSDMIILCAIDFSESSRQALRWAVSTARQLKAHLTLLYTYRLMHSRNGEAVQLKKDMEKQAALNFASLEKQYLAGQGISYDFIVEVGFIADRLEDQVRKNSIGLLVVDKNMSSASKETFDEILDNIHVPLVIVP